MLKLCFLIFKGVLRKLPTLHDNEVIKSYAYLLHITLGYIKLAYRIDILNNVTLRLL